MRHRLPKSALKKLPIHKFKQGDPFETCCICLDDFEEGDKLRILPCDHGYHSKCIDSWLLKHKRICPQCRKRVFSRGTVEESDNDSDNERAPLLGAAGPSTGGTFSTSTPGTSGSRYSLLIYLPTPFFCMFTKKQYHIFVSTYASTYLFSLLSILGIFGYFTKRFF